MPRPELTEIYSDGSRACHQVYPYRPDAKIPRLVHACPFDVLLSGTFQFTRGVQTVGAGPAILRDLDGAGGGRDAGARSSAVGWPAIGRIISLIQPGTVYGSHNLNQLDLRVSKQGFRLQHNRFRVDFDALTTSSTDNLAVHRHQYVSRR